MLANALLQELEMEAATTRRLLERVPEARLDWTPAAPARTLGQLAWHIAVNPGSVATLASQNPAQLPSMADAPTPTSTASIVAALDASLVEAKRILAGMSDADLLELWRVRAGDRELMAMPRIAFIRSILLNHWYHHRGQLSVYLRELGVPLPSIYGPSADENPFAPPA